MTDNTGTKKDQLQLAVERNAAKIKSISDQFQSSFTTPELTPLNNPTPQPQQPRELSQAEQELARIRARNENAWATDSELSTFWGGAKNMAAGAAVGTARFASHLAQAQDNASANTLFEQAGAEAIDAYGVDRLFRTQRRQIDEARLENDQQLLTGKIDEATHKERNWRLDSIYAQLEQPTEAQSALLNQQLTQAPDIGFETYAEDGVPEAKPMRMTAKQAIDKGISHIENAASIDEFFTKNDWIDGIFNDALRDDLDSEVAQAWEGTQASRDKVTQALDAGDNVTAATEGAKVLAELVWEGLGSLASNPQATLEYAAENLPQLAVGAAGKLGLATMTAGNIGYGLDAYRQGVEDYIKENGKPPSAEKNKQMFQAGIAAGLTEALADKLLLGAAGGAKASKSVARNILNNTTNVLGTGVKEGLTEAVQTGLEQIAGGKEIDEVSGQEIYAGAVIGAGAGGAIATPASSVNAVRDTVVAKADAALADKVQETEQIQALANEAETIRDSQSAKEFGSQIAEKIINKPSTGVAILSKLRASNNQTESEQSANTGSVSLLIARGMLGAFTDKSRGIVSQLEALEDSGKTNSREYRQLTKELGSIGKARKAINEVLTQIESESAKSTVPAVVATLTAAQERTPDVEAAAGTLISLVENDEITNSRVNDSSIEQVLNSSSGILSSAEKIQLASFKIARQAIEAAVDGLSKSDKDWSGVQRDVLFGSDDGRKLGANQYREQIMAALQAGDIQTAQSLEDKLRAFSEEHSIKAETFEKHYALAQQNPKYSFETKYKLLAPKKGQSPYFVVDGRSAKPTRSVRLEANALAATLAEVNAAMQARGISTISGQYAVAPDNIFSPDSVQTGLTTTGENTNTTPNSPQVGQRENIPLDAYADDINGIEPAPFNKEEQAAVVAFDELPVSEDQPTEATAEPLTSEVTDAEAQPQAAEPNAVEEVSQEPDQRQTLQAKIDALKQKVAKRNFALRSKEAELKALAKSRGLSLSTVKEALKNQNKEDQQYIKAYQSQLDALNGIDGKPLNETLTTQSQADKELQAEIEASTADPQVKAKKLHRSLNLVARYFTPSRNNIVTRVSNLVEKLKATPEIALGFVGLDQLNQKQRSIIASFVDFHETHAKPEFDKLFKAKKPDFRFEDYIQYLTDESGNVTENVKTALSTAIYNWIVTDANSTYINDSETINAILGNDKNARVDSQIQELLAPAGNAEALLVRKLGKEAARTLGIKALKDAPDNVQQQLELSLGNYALAMMNNMNMLEHTAVDLEILAQHSTTFNYDASKVKTLKDGTKIGGVASFYRARFETSPEGIRLIDGMEQIVEANRESNSFFARLFDTTWAEQKPSLTPPKPRTDKAGNRVRMTMQGTNQLVPEAVQDNLEKHEQKAHSISEDVFSVFNFLSDAQQERVVGVVENIDSVHTENRKGVEGKNATLKREIQNLREWAQELVDTTESLTTPFYFRHNIWKSLRTGMVGSQVNIQASKVQRGLIRMNDWVVTLDLNTKKHVEQFKLGVAEGLDLGVDKLTIADALAKLETLFAENTHNINAAVTSIQAVLNNTATEADASTITQTVAAFGEGTHTLHALTEYAKFDLAQKAGETRFKTDLSREIDGVTNGPILGMIHFIAENNATVREMLERGGFFFDGRTSLGQYFKEGNRDSYQVLEVFWKAALESVKLQNAEATAPIRDFDNRVDELTKLFVINRSNSKAPLMTTVYGAGAGSQNRALAGVFKGIIFENIEKIVNDPLKDEETKLSALDYLSQQVNYIAQDNVLSFKGITQASDALEVSLNRQGERSLDHFVNKSYGESVQQAIDANFGEFKYKRQVLNDTAEFASALFKVLLEQRVRERTEQLIAEGKLLKGFETLPVAERQQIEAELREFMPIVESYHGGGTEAGIFSGSYDRMNTDSPEYSVNTSFGSQVEFIGRDGEPNRKATKSMSSSGQQLEVAKSGVATAILNIHATDATIANNTYGEHSVLNVHDGFGASILDALTVGETLNRNTFEILSEHNLGVKTLALRDRLMAALETLDPALREQAIRDAEKQIEAWKPADVKNKEDYVPFDWAAQQLAVDVAFTNAATDLKALMDSVVEVHQYNIETGGFKTGNEPKPLTEAAPTPSPKRAGSFVLDAFGSARRLPVAQVVESLVARLSQGNADPRRKGQVALLTAAMRALKGDVQITLVNNTTQLTPTQSDALRNNGGSLGIYDPNTNEMFLHDETMGNLSGVQTGETFIHELMHAALTRLLTAEKQSAATKRAIADLEQIRSAVAEHLKRNPDDWALMPQSREADGTLVASPLINIDELVAWGMSNGNFQTLLKKIPMQTKQRKTNGFKRFINAVQKMLFQNSTLSESEQLNTAMAELVENTGLLLKEAENASDYAFKGDIPQYREIRRQAVESMTSEEVFNALEGLDTRRDHERSTEHKTHLAQVLNDLVDRVAGPFGSDLAQLEGLVGTQADQFIQSLVDGTASFSSKLAHTFNLSAQEAYVAAQVEATFGELMDQYSDVSDELKRLHELAQNGLTWRDFLNPGEEINPSVEQQEMAQAKYDSLFTPTTDETTNEYREEAQRFVKKQYSKHLQRFAALALTHEPFRTKLDELDAALPVEVAQGKPVLERLHILWNRFLSLLSKLMNPAQRVAGSTAGVRLGNLMHHMAVNQVRHKTRLAALEARSELAVNSRINRVINQAKNRITEIGFSDKVQNSNLWVSTAGTAAGILASGKAAAMIDVMTDLRRKVASGRLGVLGELVNEVRGSTEIKQGLHDRLRFTKRDIDQARAQATDWIKDLVNSSFAQQMTLAQSTAMTKAVLKTDLSVLLENPNYDLNDIRDFLNPATSAKLAAEIKKLRSQLSQYTYHHYYRNQARALGFRMATGKVTLRDLNTNAHNIAHMGGTGIQLSVNEANAVQPLIDTLATLEAIKYTPENHKQAAYDVLVQEMRREDGGNGFIEVMHQAKLLREQALTDIFAGDPTNMEKGYSFEILDPHQSIQMRPASEIAEMEAQGYVNIGAIQKDAGDPNQDMMYLFARRDGGKQAFLTGLISYTSKVMRGTSLTSSLTQAGEEGAFLNSRNDMKAVWAAGATERHRNMTDSSFDPMKVSKNFLLPTLDQSGNIANYRYVMNEQTKDQVFSKNNDIADILGAQAGNIIDKGATEENNEQVLELLKEMYDTDYNNNPGAYLEISPTSSDPKLREIWKLLPYEAQKKAVDTFGSKRMYVRNDVLNLVVGYRKFSLTEVWDKLPEERAVYERAFTYTMERFFGSKAASKVKAGEDIIQELMKFTKDVLVIRNFFTLFGNVVSNTVLLSVSGVPLKQIFRGQKEAYLYADRYQKQHKEAFQLKQKLAAGTVPSGDVAKAKGRLVQLENELANSPVRDLMEAGIFQTIIEDVDTREDNFSYKSQLENWIGDRTTRVPEGLKNILKIATVSQDTALYKFLNHTTQLSDFSARYVKYKYLTEQTRNPMTKAEAVRIVMEDFVHYDIPSSRALQYANDMGLVMFTKYYLRMQKPLLRLVRENPARVLWMLVMQNLADFTAPTDSVIWSKSPMDWFFNPVSTMIGAPDEIMPINAWLHGVGIK